MGRETTLWTRARPFLDGMFQTWRVESRATSPGIPDVHYIHRKTAKVGWVELKCCRERTERRVEMRRDQVIWHIDYNIKCGGDSFILLKTLEDDLILWSG